MASKEHGEGVLAVVGLDDFLDLDCVVREEVIASVVLVAAVVAVVLPHDSKGEHLAVVVQEALEVLVGTSTFEHDFDVVLVFGQIWGVLLHVDHGAGVHEWVVGVALRGAKSHTLVGEERAGELVAVNDAEDTSVEVDVDADIQIFPGIRSNTTWLGN